MNASRQHAVAKASAQVTLVIAVCKVTKELYGYSAPVLDESSTLRRVALFLNGTARCRLTQDEQDVALSVIRNRFESQP